MNVNTLGSLTISALLATLVCSCAAAQSMGCKRVDQPTTVRSTGAAELVGDIVLYCSGALPTSPGNRVPEYQIVVLGNTALPNRTAPIVFGDWNPSDALLLIDEPDVDYQSICVPDIGAVSCPRTIGIDTSAYNVFQGKVLQDNGIAFLKVPIDGTNTGAVHIIRITNLRADPSGIPLKMQPQIVTTVLMYDAFGNKIPIDRQQVVAAYALPPMKFFPLTSKALRVPANQAPLIVTPALIPKVNPSPTYGFQLKFTEGFTSAFRRRNVGTSGGDPLFLFAQAQLGYAYYTETGFYNDVFPTTNGLSLLGLAETGTRLMLTFDHIPKNVQLWASMRDEQGTTAYSVDAPKALMTTTSDATFGGDFSPVAAFIGDYTQIATTNGSATVVWEIVSADPFFIEDFVFNFALTAQGGVPGLGTANVTPAIAPLAIKRTDGTIPLPSFLVSTPTATITTTTTTIGTAISKTVTTTTATATAVPAFSIVSTIPGQKIAAYSAASFATSVAPGGLAYITVPGLVAGTPTSQVNVAFVDSLGVQTLCKVLSVSASQVTCQVSSATRAGLTVVNVTSVGKVGGSGLIVVAQVAPAMFTADGSGAGVASGNWFYGTGTNMVSGPLATLDPTTGLWVGRTVDVTPASGIGVYLSLKATGLADRSPNGYWNAQVGGINIPVTSIASDPLNPGVDIVQLGPLPEALKGRGLVDIQLTVDGVSANRVQAVF